MSKFRFTHWRWVVAINVALFGRSTVLRAQDAPRHPEVDVILWFDTEDYLLPADDDAARRLAEMLSERGIHATFKVVAEKARVLEQRGRGDVIAAMKKHTIGYHSNLHSVHPTPTEYLADCGLLDGMAEFVRREGQGAAEVRRIFGVPTLACYGQPGSSWAPQAIAALGECGVSNAGVPCYLDSGSHVGMGGRPFWYEGVLNVYNMKPNETRMELFDPKALPEAEKQFGEIADRLAGDGGGLISIFYHPCEWVHEQFWDSVNFRGGMNPPREQWKPPAQRPAEETEAAFQQFGAYIDSMRSRPGIRFITARDLPALYPDVLAADGATEAEVLTLAKRILSKDFEGLDDQTIGSKVFSPAEQFELLSLGVARHIETIRTPGSGPMTHPSALPIAVIPGLLGPDAEAPAPASPEHAVAPLMWPALRDATLDTRDYLNFHHRLPARVFVGANAVAPADFVPALAKAYVHIAEAGQFPEKVAVGNAVAVLTMNHVAKDSPGLFGGWIIHKVGFRAPKVMEVAKLQAWTLKPAVRGQ